MCDLSRSTWIREALPSRPHGGKLPSQPQTEYTAQAQQTLKEVATMLLHIFILQAQLLLFGNLYILGLLLSSSSGTLWSPPSGGGEPWRHLSPLWFSTQYFSFLAGDPITTRVLFKDLVLSLGSTSHLYYELRVTCWLLFLLWLIVCLMDYSDMLQVTTVQISSILQMKKQRCGKFVTSPGCIASKSRSWYLNSDRLGLFLPLQLLAGYLVS